MPPRLSQSPPLKQSSFMWAANWRPRSLAPCGAAVVSSAVSLGFAELLCLAPFHELCFPFPSAPLNTQLSLVLHLKSPSARDLVSPFLHAFCVRWLLISHVHLETPASSSSSSSVCGMRAL